MKEKIKKIWSIKRVKTIVILFSFLATSLIYFSLIDIQTTKSDEINKLKGKNMENTNTNWFDWDNKQELYDVVYSESAHKAIWRTLKDDDKKDFIKSYTVKKETIQMDPMGGYDFDIYINNDKKLKAGVQLSDVNGRWETWTVVMGISKKLQDVEK